MTRKNNDDFADNRISAKYHPNYRTISIFDSTLAATWKTKNKATNTHEPANDPVQHWTQGKSGAYVTAALMEAQYLA